MNFSKEDAVAAIRLLQELDEQVNGKCIPLTKEQGDAIANFLYDPGGDLRFSDEEKDGSPYCRCETCSPGNVTCNPGKDD